MTSNVQKVIDVDVHQTLKAGGSLLPYMAEPYKSRYAYTGGGNTGLSLHNPIGVSRSDCRPPSGGPSASDPDFLIADLNVPYNIEYTVLTGGNTTVTNIPDPDFAAAIASAYNDYMAEHWLNDNYPMFRGSILISGSDAQLAAREIDRMAGHPKIVNIMLASGQRNLLGQRNYYPIYEAASRNGLPVSIHPGNEGAGGLPPPTGHGYPTRYLEWHTSLSQNYIAQLTSLICEGVFEKFPKLKFALLEGGIGWLPGLMWQMDKAYKQLKETMPWLKRKPSEYIRDHCMLSTQPIEEPDDPKHLTMLFDMIDAENFLMFSSDYPHWDNDMPTEILKRLRPEARQKIYYDNAKKFYQIH